MSHKLWALIYKFNLRITQHTDFNTINGLTGNKMSNTHYCGYKTKYRSKLETLDTHHRSGQHIPIDKMTNQQQETQVIISISTTQLLTDVRKITWVPASKVNIVIFGAGWEILLKWVFLLFNRKVWGFVLNEGTVEHVNQGLQSVSAWEGDKHEPPLSSACLALSAGAGKSHQG